MSKGIPPITDPSAPDSTNINSITGDKNEITWINEKKYTYGAVTNFVVGATTTLTAGAITAVSLAAVTNTLGGTKEELHMMGKADVTIGPVFNMNFSTVTKYVMTADKVFGPNKKEVFALGGYTFAKKKVIAARVEEVVVQQEEVVVQQEEVVVNRNSRAASVRESIGLLDEIVALENRKSEAIVKNAKFFSVSSFLTCYS